MMYTGELFNFKHSIAGTVLMMYAYPWQILPEWSGHLRKLGESLPKERFEHPTADVWIAKSARIAKSATIVGPCIIDEEADIRVGAFLRGNVLVGKNAVVGNSTELKNALLFDNVQVPHYNYVGDSVLGYGAHFGAGVITSNVKGDKSPVVVKDGEKWVPTGLKKCGAMVGDRAEIGCNCVLNPGTVVGADAQVYPLCSVRGVIPAGYIYKTDGSMVPKRGV